MISRHVDGERTSVTSEPRLSAIDCRWESGTVHDHGSTGALPIVDSGVA